MDRASDSGSECWGFESLRAYQARIDQKVYPSFFVIFSLCFYRQSGFVLCTRFLGKGPAGEKGATGTFFLPRLRAYQKRSTCLAGASFLGYAACKAALPFGIECAGAASRPTVWGPMSPTGIDTAGMIHVGAKFALLPRFLYLWQQRQRLSASFPEASIKDRVYYVRVSTGSGSKYRTKMCVLVLFSIHAMMSLSTAGALILSI